MLSLFKPAPVGDPSRPIYLDTDENLQTNVPGLYIIGDLTGFPLIKTAINQGTEMVDRLEAEVRRIAAPEEVYDLIIVGAGAAGLSAALRAQEKGLRYVVLEQGRVANTIANFPNGKLIFDEPTDLPAQGGLYVAETTKEDLLNRWMEQIERANLALRTMEPVTNIRRERADCFVVETGKGTYVGKRVLLAIGKRGNPRKLNAPGEGLMKVRNELHNPEQFRGQDILVAGGGDSGVETALALCDQNRVTFAVSSDALTRPKAKNIARMQAAVAAGKVDLRLRTQVKEITEREVKLQQEGKEVVLPNDAVFAMIGADPPLPFLRKIGVRVKGAWTSQRFAVFAAMMALFFVIYTIYKYNPSWLKPIAERLPPNWYGLFYSVAVGLFGLHVLLVRRPRHVRFRNYIRLRTLSSMFFQVGVYFILPLLILPIFGVKEPWLIVKLIYVWPLGMTNLSRADYQHAPWIFWAGFAGSFVLMPIFVYFFGKRYCSFVCGCGALAETMGDSTRDLAPKGEQNRRRELIVYGVLIWSALYTLYHWISPPLFGNKAPAALNFLFGTAYGFVVEWFWAGVLGVGAYFTFGNRMWCRYGCPLAILMNLYGKFGLKSRFKITANDKCIDCGQCNRYCQMGIDVKSFALQQKPLTLEQTPCIGCGECIAVCPMDVLKLGDQPAKPKDGLIRDLPLVERRPAQAKPEG